MRSDPGSQKAEGHGKKENGVRRDNHGDPLPELARCRLGTLRFRNANAGIVLMRFTPDGRSLFTVGSTDRARLWEASTGRERNQIMVPPGGNWLVTPDCRLLVTWADSGSTIRIWRTATGKMLRKLSIPNYRVNSVCLWPNGKTLMAAATDENTDKPLLRLWPFPGGTKFREIEPSRPRGRKKEFLPQKLLVDPTGKWLHCLGRYGDLPALRRWDLATEKEVPALAEFPGEDGRPTLSPNGNFLAVVIKRANQKTTVRLLEVATGKTLHEFPLPRNAHVPGMRFSPDGRTLAAVATVEVTDQVYLWRVADGKALPKPNLDDFSVVDLGFSPDGRTLAVQQEENIRLVRVTSGKLLHLLNTSSPVDDLGKQTGPNPDPTLPQNPTFAFSPHGKRLAARATGDLIRLWDTTTGKEIRPVRGGHEAAVVALAVSPNGRTVASVGRDNTLRLWDVPGGREIRTLPLAGGGDVRIGDMGRIGWWTVAFSPDGKTVAAGSPFNLIRVWDVATGKRRAQFPTPPDGASALAFMSDAKKLIAGGQGRLICMEATTGNILHHFVGPRVQDPEIKLFTAGSGPPEVALSPDGRLLAAGVVWRFREERFPTQFQVGIFELTSGNLRQRLPGNLSGEERFDQPADNTGRNLRHPPGLAFSPDCKMLAWNQGRCIELWDLARARPFRRLGGPAGHICGIAFSPTGNLLAIASYDGEVQCLDPATGTLRGRFRAPRGGFNCLAFSQDGKTLFTGGEDTTILLWDVAQVLKRWQPAVPHLSAKELNGLWERLGSAKGTEAGEAMGRLQTIPRQAVQMFGARIQPVKPVSPRKMARLVGGLESKRFRDRQLAFKELERLEELAEPFLRKRLAEDPPLEVRQRLENLLKKLGGFVTRPDRLRLLRAVEVLERIGTADARALLRDLAKGAPAARLTREAKSALRRLEHRPRR
jgi:WD40 repeat protein